jgi:hypothetical protein
MGGKSHPIENDPSRGDIYQGDRNGEYLRIVYIDDQIVALRGEQTHRNSDRNVHRFPPRHQFDQQVERGRLTHAPDADVDIPKGDMQMENAENKTKTGGQPAATEGGDSDGNNTQIDAFVESGRDGDTDENNQVSGGDAGESGSVENSSSGNGNGSTDESATDHEDWTDVAYVGDEAANNLYNHGIKTVDDIDAASDDELSEVPLVGDRVIGNLRDFVAE